MTKKLELKNIDFWQVLIILLYIKKNILDVIHYERFTWIIFGMHTKTRL